MKLLRKTRVGVIDDLLRAYVSRPSNVRHVCPDFDPDLANSYIEHSLTPSSRSRYEQHLSQCVSCRKSVVALTALAASESSPLAPASRGEARPGWLLGVRQMIGSMSAPQWAMATAAVIVLAISVPLLLSRGQMRDASVVSEQLAQTPSNEQPRSATAPVSRAADVKPGELASRLETPASKPREKRENDTASVGKALAVNAPAAPADERAAESQQQKTVGKEVPEALDRVQEKSKSQDATQPAQTSTQALAEGQIAKTDSNSARQERGKDADRAGESKQSRADDQATQKREEARAEAAPPPAPAPGSGTAGRMRRGLRQSGAKLALRDSETAEAVRPAEKKVYGKNFTLKEGTWTDKDFDPDKDLPIVTIIRDSNVYKEVLTKRAKLKPFFAGFSPTERAIIVYKGTVYKLIPQQNDK